jgi:hypothetical protein
MKITIPLLLFLTAVPGLAANPLKISVDEYRHKVYASWLGQCIGNIYGLPHENQYINAPGPLTLPYGYKDLRRIGSANGAFSDDDTDLEYMYLLAMEEHGPEPTYAQLARRWKHHIRDRLWLANRAALALMHHGLAPPYTGMRKYNPHWFQIDPQLVNEIWAVTAPGMIRYASGKSDWAARITNDSWGVEPTIHYGAMYAAAFFESDVEKLVDIGTRSLPPGNRFGPVVEEMKALYRKYPSDMASARKEMADKYYVREGAETKTIWNAILNGAAGILALLYGQGDFRKTLDVACYLGFDADNQAATMSGLVALIRGVDGIPKDLLYVFPDRNWKLPLNDVYKNVSRYDMPDASLRDMAGRMAKQGEAVILKHGGRKINEGGREYYLINPDAAWTPPLELPAGPLPMLQAGQPVKHTFLASGCTSGCAWKVDGKLPAGLSLRDGILTGTPATASVSRIRLIVTAGAKQAALPLTLFVRPANLATSAAAVLSGTRQVREESLPGTDSAVAPAVYARDVNVIRDGIRFGEGSAFSSVDATGPKTDYYGYEWTEPQTIGALSLGVGVMGERAGWFENLRVEFRNERGDWEDVLGTTMAPPLPGGRRPFDKPHFSEYVIAFEPVTTTAIRIAGDAPRPRRETQRTFTSVTELSVYAPVAGLKDTMRAW